MTFLNKPFGKFIFALFTGLLLTLGWTPSLFVPLLFLGFVPLFFIIDSIHDDRFKRKGLRHFGYVYLTLLLWNVGTTWWVFYSSDWGSIAAFGFNTLFMTIIFQFAFLTRKKLGEKMGFLSLVFYWIAFEYLHLYWELSWPWLTLGFSLASFPSLIQWYEFTGVLGGSVWIMTINILCFLMIKNLLKNENVWKQKAKVITAIIIIPILISVMRYASYNETSKPKNVVVVQPNIDPYNEKFSGNDAEQLDKMLKLAAQKVDSNTDYVVFPETALAEAIWEEYLDESPSIKAIRSFIKPYPKLNFVCGMSSQRRFKEGETISETARQDRSNPKDFFDDYNASIQLDNSDKIQIYHKSKLVPGVEKMPYPKLFGFLGKYAIDLGGTTGSYGTQKDRTVFHSIDGKCKIGTPICYESIYGDFLTGYLKNGANFLFIITNDGWWSDSPGYRQHCNYGRLAAIEFRRSIARSANTGTSCFINQRGDIMQPTAWWKPAVISQSINANDTLTFYAKHGDYLGILAAIATLFSLLALLVSGVLKRQSR